MRPLFSVAAVILSALTLSNCQVCELYSTSNLETLISGSITGEPNTVCLASGSRRDTYRDASVVVTVGGQLRQLDLSCSGSTWSLESNGSPTGGSLTTALRRDCNDCSATSNDPTFDNVTHCVGKLLQKFWFGWCSMNFFAVLTLLQDAPPSVLVSTSAQALLLQGVVIFMITIRVYGVVPLGRLQTVLPTSLALVW